MDELGQVDLLVGSGLTACAGGISQGHGQLGDALDDLVGQGHEVAQGGTDDIVQRDEDGEGQEGPQTAGHGVDTLAGVEVGDLLLLTLLVVGVLLLDLLHLAVHAAHAEHTFLALELEGKDHQLHQQGEEDQRHAVRPGPGIEQTGQPGKGNADVVAELCEHRLVSSVRIWKTRFQGTGSYQPPLCLWKG